MTDRPLRTVSIAIARAVERAMGRRTFARSARFIWHASIFSDSHDIEVNGEALLQRHVALGDARPVVIDVGAHFGEWATSMLSALDPFQSVVLFAFEPAPGSFESVRTRLREHAAANRDLQAIQTVVSNRKGNMTLYVRDSSAGDSSLYPVGVGETPVQVPALSIDAFCRERGIQRVTLLKSDAEGHDFAVIQGAERMLAEGKIGLVQFEYNARWIDARRYLRDAFKYLRDFGYMMGKVTRKGIEIYPDYDFELENFVQGNYIGLRQDWVPRLPTFTWWKAVVR